MPDFISPAPDEHHHADDEQEAITEAFSALDWALSTLADEARTIHADAAADVHSEVQERIQRLINVAKSFSQAAMGV